MLFFFKDTATTEIYTLSLHDALPIYHRGIQREPEPACAPPARPARHQAEGDAGERKKSEHRLRPVGPSDLAHRSEEHTSELQSHVNLVCRLLLEKKKTTLTIVYGV